MSVSRHHAEWRELIEVSGPFLSMAVLEQVFPQGIETVESDLRERLRVAHEEWLDETSGSAPDLAIHQAFVRYVFREALGYHEGDILQDHASLRVEAPEHRDTLAATFAVVNPDGRTDGGKPRLFVSVLGAHENVDKPSASAVWKIPAVDRMLYLLRGMQAGGAATRLGFVTNGDDWVLIHVAPNETATYVRWSAELWFDEPLTLRSLVTFVGARRLFGVPEDETFEALIRRSAKDSHEVTGQLGSQVRRATEVLVQTIDRVDRGRRGRLLAQLSPVNVYEGAVTIMMRLIFVLAAEERKLLLLGTQMYDQHYAVSTLHDQLQGMADRHGEEALEMRFDAWVRLLSTFRAIYAGIEHDQLRIPAHGGSLFDPDRFPFLEGRALGTSFRDLGQKAAEPLAIDNRTVLHLLRAITRLDVKAGGGSVDSRRLSFRELDVEQIGHVYEGLLDHTAKRAEDVTVSLTGRREPEISLKALEGYKRKSSELVSFLVEETGRSETAVEGAFQYKIPKTEDRQLLAVCENVTATYERVKPWAGLIRKDTHGLPVVIPKGALYVTEGTDRRSTGTHYTPRSLTEAIVQHTLEPAVYAGPAEGKTRDAWTLKSAKELLALRVCDLAMGSGAFLVEACRYLAARLVEAWEAEEKRQGGKLLLAPDGALSAGATSEQAIPTDTAERLALAKRYIADRCLYGVDVNPWAVEMGKLSLWLTTMQKGRPFSFLDHALRSGDSLVGVTDEKQLLHFHLDPARGKKLHDNMLNLQQHMRTALARSRECREKLEDFATNDISDIERKAWLLGQANEATQDLRVVGDLVVGAALATTGDLDEHLRELSLLVVGMLDGRSNEVRSRKRAEARTWAEGLFGGGGGHRAMRPLHWAIEFPEVVQRGGFDAFLGNPPFMGGKRITTTLGERYAFALKHFISDRKGAADLAAYCLVRAFDLLNQDGFLGLILTNSINEGDTRDIGLAETLRQQGVIYRALTNCPWPGGAGITVSNVHVAKRTWAGTVLLEGRTVARISEYLASGTASGEPHRLNENIGIAATGTYVNGAGFVVDEETYASFVAASQNNEAVLLRYLTSQDLNQRPRSDPSRYVINFGDMSRPEAERYGAPFRQVLERVKPARDKLTRQVHETCFWKHWDRREQFYKGLRKLKRALVLGRVSTHHAVTFMETTWIAFDGVVMFMWDDWGHFALLQSGIHEVWCARFRTSLRTDPRYSVSDCFMTFPLPDATVLSANVEAVGADYFKARADLMLKNDEGLTSVYHRFHDPSESGAGIVTLRGLAKQLDERVLRAYGWSDINLDFGFQETKHGLRYSMCDNARIVVLERLLALNQERGTDGGDVKTRGGTPSKKGKARAKAHHATKRMRDADKQTTFLDEED